MPYTRKQVKLFLSDSSPLTGDQQEQLKQELHTNPSFGHAKKGSAALKRPRKPPVSHGFNWRNRHGLTQVPD